MGAYRNSRYSGQTDTVMKEIREAILRRKKEDEEIVIQESKDKITLAFTPKKNVADKLNILEQLAGSEKKSGEKAFRESLDAANREGGYDWRRLEDE